VTDQDGKLTTKLGVNGKARQIDTNDPAQLEEFYASEGRITSLAKAEQHRPQLAVAYFQPLGRRYLR